MSVALNGIKVLDLSRVLAGPWATMTLGDLGADVLKIEQPGTGDDTRTWMPPAVEGVSTYYLGANRNKKSVAIDIGKPEGRDLIIELAKKSDVLIENFRPASLKKFKLTYDDLKDINPRLIYCSISGYGRGHELEERPGYDFIIQAESGFMSITGEKDGEPMRLGVAFIDLISGMNAVQAILAALFMRERTGKGQWLDISLTDSAMFMLANVASGHLNTGREALRYGNAHPSIVPYQLFDCVDGRIALAVGNDEQFRRFCKIIGLPDLAMDERFVTNKGRTEARDELLPIIEDKLRDRKLHELLAELRAVGVPAGELRTVGQAFASDVAILRDTVVSVPSERIGTFRSVRSPLRMSESPFAPPTLPPEVGEHTRQVLQAELDLSADRVDQLLEMGVVAGIPATTRK
ncbi:MULTISPECIES: CaiB/BaiF CoA-transferase family protein [Alphaproteobacteria]|jgi:crotonobetainyl-CoA:carnitine CoA-transferase CaiB-like acyl-CoA transferase|uniref:CoA transferase n=6 Tax=Alphaproteobacteria TaxID=28211 RepID=A0A6L3YFB1_9HYPH|nr:MULTISPECIES: CaiB/BaiF CoA-transferase family protein [Alphaproteobacteria]KZZ27767.1 CoA-transferase [Sulfitobacter sp. HI0082]MBA3038774.1 CoA transferase [Rhizobiaceae bacterium]KAB2680289.1 CoA transferase [Brucella tritici]MBN9217104.1 CoA transferase [Mesorhizobium sp.]SDH02835.1 Crotonobetainyl-CoA:carnitine CoA-transferase CaiB [Sulfitobacter delicatus]